ncbi:Asparaginase/glutaminase [Stachybotrys elegans]|uniref:asparaginase n=1 Tax=Stachybotrys elegans TaxID=80388 RepID=A0A8K0SH39_9HYPO|nr:Asparaginase/glutaminase [Stachybotrys elegans]
MGVLVSSASASPVPALTGHLFAREAADFSCFNASLPNVTIYATGGTIAGSAASSGQTTGYQAGAIGIQTLIDAVPQLCNVSNVRGVQVANVGSTEITPNILVNISQLIQQDLDSGYTQGVVVTHGTDTLEESAFFLDLTVKSEHPVVVVGAMRPATAISADGPMNLLASVRLAASKSAMGRGTMVVLNDRIASARYATKTNANMVDTFKAEEQGFLGAFQNIQPVFYYPPARPLGYYHFDISKSSPEAGLPEVDILFGHQALQPGLVQAAVDLGAKGLVVAGMGAGSWTKPGIAALEKVFNETGLAVIDSRRMADVFVDPPSWDFAIGGGYLNPQKCRIQLQLALEVGLPIDAIKNIFEYTGVN